MFPIPSVELDKKLLSYKDKEIPNDLLFEYYASQNDIARLKSMWAQNFIKNIKYDVSTYVNALKCAVEKGYFDVYDLVITYMRRGSYEFLNVIFGGELSYLAGRSGNDKMVKYVATSKRLLVYASHGYRDGGHLDTKLTAEARKFIEDWRKFLDNMSEVEIPQNIGQLDIWLAKSGYILDKLIED